METSTVEIRGDCHVCGTQMELSAPAPAPVVCARPQCGTAVRDEQQLVTTLVNAPQWRGVTGLARATGLSPAAVVRVLIRLEDRGWVEARSMTSLRRWWFQRAPRVYRLTNTGARAVRWIFGCGGTP